MFLSWIQRPVRVLFGRTRRAACASAGLRKVRLSLEVLEGRTLPSALTVAVLSAPHASSVTSSVLMATDSGHPHGHPPFSGPNGG